MKDQIALCDLLIGRALRLRAADAFEEALLSDSIAEAAPGLPLVLATQEALRDSRLDRASHFEWIARRAEAGQIHWGGRWNRCGWCPRQDDEQTAFMTWWEVTLS